VRGKIESYIYIHIKFIKSTWSWRNIFWILRIWNFKV